MRLFPILLLMGNLDHKRWQYDIFLEPSPLYSRYQQFVIKYYNAKNQLIYPTWSQNGSSLIVNTCMYACMYVRRTK